MSSAAAVGSAAPGAQPLRRRAGTAAPPLPSAPRRRFCLWCVKWLEDHPDHVCLQRAGRTRCDRCTTNGSLCHKVPSRYRVAAVRVQTDAAAIATLSANRRAAARTVLAAAAATVGSRVDRFNRHRRGEAGDRSQLSLYERSTLRFQELLLAQLDSLESAYRAAHGQPPVIPEDDESDEDGGDDDGGDDDGDGNGAGAAGVGAGGS
ncbi:MAG: hypothetical protein M1816_004122 [Peltula sp. TS41687]|nr:MAG: hypothetical protein M1816_004122 [Peltula sp. TS41687]